MNRRLPVALIIAALSVIASSCGGDGDGETVTIGGQRVESHGQEDVSGESSIEFETDDFYFEPTVLIGEPGQRITLDAFNEGDAVHSITIDEQQVDRDIQPGQEGVQVAVEFPGSGAVELYCKYHRRQGMVAELRASS